MRRRIAHSMSRMACSTPVHTGRSHPLGRWAAPQELRRTQLRMRDRFLRPQRPAMKMTLSSKRQMSSERRARRQGRAGLRFDFDLTST